MKNFCHAILLLLTIILVFASCKFVPVSSQQNGHVVSQDSGMGFIKWESIPAAESKISIIDEEGYVLARREKVELSHNLLSQAFKFSNGSLLYEKRDDVPRDIDILSPEKEIIKRYAGHPELLSQGLMIESGEMSYTPDVEGTFHHVIVESEKKKCMIFFGYSPESTLQETDEKRSYQVVTGSICARVGTEKALSLQQDVLDLLSRIRFDDGEYTRKQLLAKAFAKLDKLEEERVRQESKDQTGPEIYMADTVETDREEVTFSGRIVDDSEIDMVRIGNDWVKLNDDGTFSLSVKVPMGTSQLQLVALDQYGNSSVKDVGLLWKKRPVEKVEEPAPERMGEGDFYALLIGNSQYQHWRDLDTPHYDVQSLSETLTGKYNFIVKEIMVDSDHEKIFQALNNLRDEMGPNDNLLIYFSGHGVLHKGKGYWVPVDGYLDDPEKWIPNLDINRALRRIPSRNVIVVADSCYSGTLAQERIATDEKRSRMRRSRTAMSAGSGDEVVLEPVLAEGEKDNSVFAKKLINVLETNQDEIRDGYDIFLEVKSQLKMYPQHPQYGALSEVGHEGGGDFYFVKHSRKSL